jgi:extracellular elastinolytic metalloproteinase
MKKRGPVSPGKSLSTRRTPPDLWTLCVDAQSGEILVQHNHTVYCKAGHAHVAGENCQDGTAETQNSKLKTQNSKLRRGSADASYRVFALPTESPAHGPHELIVNPHDLQASPFGWHDVNGADGAEYTYTRGNNVWAFDDRANDNTGSPDESADGGANPCV